MSFDPSGWEILSAEEDTVFSKSPDDIADPILLLDEIPHRKRHREKQPKFRSKHSASLQSPPKKRKHFVTKSPTQMSVNTSLDCFFHSTPQKSTRSQSKKTFWQKKKVSESCFVVKSKEMKMFFKLTEDEVISQFLIHDGCCRVADKYLLAMVFAYFKRANLSLWEYTRINFFIALYLANDVEEDEEEMKYEIFPWALGRKWKERYPQFLKKRDKLLRLIDYKAIVSRRCSDEIMAIEPEHSLWKRERPQHHAGAIRTYMKDPEDDGYPRGPDASPRYCAQCDAEDSQYDSASPSSVSWFIASSPSPSTPENLPHHTAAAWMRAAEGGRGEWEGVAGSFDMKGLKRTLPAHDAFPGVEE